MRIFPGAPALPAARLLDLRGRGSGERLPRPIVLSKLRVATQTRRTARRGPGRSARCPWDASTEPRGA
eukprot:12019669-Alexandrium_andersonii.AAC.1